MDRTALRTANLLVGNGEGEAAIEMTLVGPALRLEEAALLAITGADLSAMIDGQPAPSWRPLLVEAGSVLEFGRLRAGCRAYLAVGGGFDVPAVLGSRGTDLRARIGGFHGRALVTGDVLPLGGCAEAIERGRLLLRSAVERPPIAYPRWFAAHDPGERPATVRLVRGGQFGWFSAAAQRQLLEEPFQVGPQSDRMGYRLAGPRLELTQPRTMLSEATAAGTVQVPPDGNPIVLMADHPPTGGYPKIAHVITADLGIVAQARPGDTIRFQEISIDEAQRLHRQSERALRMLAWAMRLRERSSVP
jgi:antagonist of KipI